MSRKKVQKEMAKDPLRERRAKARFAIQREMRIKVLRDGRAVETSAGNTVDMSSSGVSFRHQTNLAVGSFVELSISWPILLEQECPMRLIVFGRVLRSGGGVTACSIDKYEFRTQARGCQTDAAPRIDSMLQRFEVARAGAQ